MAVKQEIINMGNTVLCDLCNADYTDCDDQGGFQFGSKAVCPGCAPEFEKTIIGYEETHYILARAYEGESFRDFVYRLRGGRPGVITITSFGED